VVVILARVAEQLLIADVNNAHPLRDASAYARWSTVLIAKMTEGSTFVAPTFVAHRAAARRSGLRAFGAYHFWDDRGDAARQAEHALTTLGTLSDDPVEWLILDVEQGVDFAAYDEFCRIADARLGRRTWLYGGQQLARWPYEPRPLWIARYFDHTPDPVRRPGIGEVLWQFSDCHNMPGVGAADCSVHFGTVDTLLAAITGGPMPTLDNDDLDAVETRVRRALNEGTGRGQSTWRATNKQLFEYARDAAQQAADAGAAIDTDALAQRIATDLAPLVAADLADRLRS
jgi:hypothetical protein